MEKEFHWLHFIGIKGVGMSALAIVAKGMGYKVTGSDVAEEFITDSSLTEAGVEIQPSFVASHIIPDIDIVILGAAFGEDNPELKRAKKLNLPIWTYSELLGFLSGMKKTLAVAGTHGKTTTSSILAFLLYKANLKPSWVIGTGHVTGLPSHGMAGEGDYFVTEADDYKRATDDPTPKFLDLTPYGAIITSIEHDHPDLYPTLKDCVQAFRQFIGKVVPDGFLVVNGDDRNITLLMEEFPKRDVITYGFDDDVDYQIIEEGDTFQLLHEKEKIGPFELQLPGMHNRYNAAAAIVIALRCGVNPEEIAAILPQFESVERRYQILGEKGGVTVIDDYAHHPTAIQYTLETAKKQFSDRPIWCVFQPHTYSRTKALLHEFGMAFGSADMVILTDIFASAREKDVTVTIEELKYEVDKHHTHVEVVKKAELLAYLKQHLPINAVLLTMGAGDIYKIGKAIIES